MRLGVLDVGSNSIKLQIVDAVAGKPPLPIRAFKGRLKLSETASGSGEIRAGAMKRIIGSIQEAMDVASEQSVTDLECFATEAIRHAPNKDVVCTEIHAATGIELQVLAGEEEASFGFLAARRWFGWSSGRLLHLDLGGGSMQVAFGDGEYPGIGVSLPLGMGLLSRLYLPDDPPSRKHTANLRDAVRAELREVAERLRWEGRPTCAAASSKTFKQLAQLCGAAGARQGALVPRRLDLVDLRKWVDRMATMDVDERANLAGVKPARASNIFAGAVVAECAMRALELDRVRICPWGVREGVLLHRLDQLQSDERKKATQIVREA